MREANKNSQVSFPFVIKSEKLWRCTYAPKTVTDNNQGPVVQSISFMKLYVKNLVMSSSTHKIKYANIVLLTKCEELLYCKSSSHFFGQKW